MGLSPARASARRLGDGAIVRISRPEYRNEGGPRSEHRLVQDRTRVIPCRYVRAVAELSHATAPPRGRRVVGAR